MFESFFGLSGKPFSLLPDSDFLFLSKRHSHVVNLLDYGTVTEAGFIVITGDVGAGKTTIIRRFLKQAGADLTVGLITNPSPALGRLLSWVVTAYGINARDKSEIELHSAFVDFLLAQYARGKRTVLIIDEAQNMTAAMLEELRMLSNVNNEKDSLLQVILVGQPELLETLGQPNLRQFVQRISVQCHLGPMAPAETASYIRHRLETVGGSPDIFDNKACAAVHYFAGGVPRLINLLCEQALVYAYSEDRRTVDFETVAEVVSDRKKSGLSPFRDLGKYWSPAVFLMELQPILYEIDVIPAGEKRA